MNEIIDLITLILTASTCVATIVVAIWHIRLAKARVEVETCEKYIRERYTEKGKTAPENLLNVQRSYTNRYNRYCRTMFAKLLNYRALEI